ncbi:MAG: hypothetical protein R2911_13610 [Caldilineaceae bacterium]
MSSTSVPSYAAQRYKRNRNLLRRRQISLGQRLPQIFLAVGEQNQPLGSGIGKEGKSQL